MTCNWCLRLHVEVFELNGGKYWFHYDQNNRMCVSRVLKEQICLLCIEVIMNKDFKRKLMILCGQKTKACLI